VTIFKFREVRLREDSTSSGEVEVIPTTNLVYAGIGKMLAMLLTEKGRLLQEKNHEEKILRSMKKQMTKFGLEQLALERMPTNPHRNLAELSEAEHLKWEEKYFADKRYASKLVYVEGLRDDVALLHTVTEELTTLRRLWYDIKSTESGIRHTISTS